MLHQVPQHSAGCLRVGSISSCMLSRGEWWSAKPQEATKQQHTCWPLMGVSAIAVQTSNGTPQLFADNA